MGLGEMRNVFLLGAASLALASCGGGSGAGPETVGSTAPPTSPNGDAHTFVRPTAAKTYDAIGAVQHYQYETRSDRDNQTAQLYAADANTVRDSGITVTYDPRDAIFNIAIARPRGETNTQARFQDPVHRTAFGGNSEPQVGVPPTAADKGIQYLEAGSVTGEATARRGNYPVGAPGYKSAISTFFYQKPGTTTQYVTYGGFVENEITATRVTETVYNEDGTPRQNPDGTAVTRQYVKNAYNFDRAVFAWGERTDGSAVPRTGTASFSGDMLATMVYNDRLDIEATAPTYFQWLTGTNTTVVDFAKSTVTTTLNGTINTPAMDANTSGIYTIPGGSSFAATGSATIDLLNTGGFAGSFSDARIRAPGAVADTVVDIAGSSIDGAFFGPAAQEIGAGFRIVGGTPDQRIDILGTFTGKK